MSDKRTEVDRPHTDDLPAATPAEKLADRNYPSDYEWANLIHRQQDDYDRKMVENLKAMLVEARGFAELWRLAERCITPNAGGVYTQARALHDLETWMRARRVKERSNPGFSGSEEEAG